MFLFNTSITVNNDPSRTITMRNRAIADVNRRVAKLKKDIRDYLVAQNKLEPISVNAFEYRFAEQKHIEFMEWLGRQHERGLLELIYMPTPYSNVRQQQVWMDYYIWSAYQKGLATSRREIKQSGVELPSYMKSAQFPFDLSFFGPIHSEAVALMFTRVFTDLKGVTQAMDSAISRTLAQGMIDGLGPEQIARNIARNVDSIGMVRARLIARTEMIHAYNSSKLNDHVGMEDIIDEEILVKWRTAGDERVRHPRHTARHNKIYKRSDARRLLGEPNCLIGESVVHSLGNIERTFKRFYDGDIVIIRTASGNEVSCTPNHPILTDSGLLPASSVGIGTNVLCSSFTNSKVSSQHNEDNVISRLHEKGSAFSLPFMESLIHTVSLDFHGDGTDGDVCIIRSDSKLGDDRISDIPFFQHFDESTFSFTIMQNILGSSFSSLLLDLQRVLLPSTGGMGFSNLVRSLNRSHLTPFDEFLFGSTFDRDVVFDKSTSDYTSITLEMLRNRVEGFAGSVSMDQVVSVDVQSFHGFVYNLQSEFGLYIAQNKQKHNDKTNGVITGNCRCVISPYMRSVHGDVENNQWGPINPVAGR